MADQRSNAAHAYHDWYKTARWQHRREAHLHEEPLCRMCMAVGILNDGSRRADGSPQPNRRRHFRVADHVDPHRGNANKFWNGELQTLCPDHHDQTKQQAERRGYEAGVDASGHPTDPHHPWNRR